MRFSRSAEVLSPKKIRCFQEQFQQKPSKVPENWVFSHYLSDTIFFQKYGCISFGTINQLKIFKKTNEQSPRHIKMNYRPLTSEQGPTDKDD